MTGTGCDIDVVVVAYGSEDLIVDCIESVVRHPAVASVVVVDNGDGRSAAVVPQPGVVTILRPDNPGFGAGQNDGARRGAAPFLLLLNPDARLLPEALDAGLAALADPTLGAVQGVVAAADGGGPERSAGRELGPAHLVGRALNARSLLGNRFATRIARSSPVLRDHVERVPGVAEDVESLAAVSVLVRRSAFEEIGGFDESYFLYGEDLDLCRRLRASGWRLLALPTPWAVHESGASAGDWWSRELRWWEGTLQFAAQWWSRGAFVASLAAAAIMCARLVVGRPSRWRPAARSLLVRPVRLRCARGGSPVCRSAA